MERCTQANASQVCFIVLRSLQKKFEYHNVLDDEALNDFAYEIYLLENCYFYFKTVI